MALAGMRARAAVRRVKHVVVTHTSRRPQMSTATKAWRRLAATTCIALAALGAAPAAQADDYTRTAHPIVLVHGFLGFDQIGPVNMFYGIPSALASGGATVYVTQQPGAQSAAVRGEALLANLKALKATHGHARFNL